MTKCFIAAMAASATTLLLASCGQATAPKPSANVITVAEAPANLGTVNSTFSYSGSVTPKWTVSIIPQASGQVTDLKVQQGQRVNQGDVIAILDHRSLDDQVAQQQANLTSAQAKLDAVKAGGRSEDVTTANASLESARQKLSQAQAGGRTESINQAQAKLDADQATLNKLLAGPVSQDITNAQLAVEQAKDRLYADQTLNDFNVARGLMTKEQRQAALDVDQTAIDQANTELAKLTAPPRPEDVAAARAAVQSDQQAVIVAKQPNRPEDIAQLQQSLISAQAQAAKAASPYTAQDVAQAQAAVDVAQAALRSAQTSQSNATITSPAAGIVSDVPIAVGSFVGQGNPVATLIAPDLEVDATVDEGQVSLFKEGQPAQIAMSSNAQNVYDGKVLLVAPAADPKTRKFAVKVVPVSSTTLLRAGMSATVKIQTGQQVNALLIPKDAVIQRSGQQVVFIDDNGRAKMSVVQTGASDDRNIQIVSGLGAGAQVILPGSLDLSDGDSVTKASSAPGPAPTDATPASASGSPAAPASAAASASPKAG